MDNKTELKNDLQFYLNNSKSKKFYVYFIVRSHLYKVVLDTITVDMVRYDYTSSSKGHHKKIRLYLNDKQKQYFILNKNAERIMSTEEFLAGVKDSKLNRGQFVECLEAERLEIPYKLDNISYKLQGDVIENGEPVQVKYENGTLYEIK